MPPGLQKASVEKVVQSGKETPCMVAVAQESAQKPPPPKPPSLAGCWLTPGSETKACSHRDFVQADILDRGPHNRQAAILGGEDVNLIGALPHVAEEAFDGIGGLNMPVHDLRKLVKREGLLLLFSQASHRFGIAFPIFGFEGRQLDECLLFRRLLPNRHKFSLNLIALSPGDRIEDIALLMHQTALMRRGRKQLPDRCQHAVMPVGHDEVDLGRSSRSQVLQNADPAIFALLCAGS